jgi:hypothetical protein
MGQAPLAMRDVLDNGADMTEGPTPEPARCGP